VCGDQTMLNDGLRTRDMARIGFTEGLERTVAGVL
jgi:hypothetical protein